MSQDSFNPFEFLTTPWGKLPLGPGAGGPTGFGGADLKELDKRINELKAVEQWLSLNLNLLKTTIQGLEVQRGTLAAIQSFTESMTSPTAPEKSKSQESAAPNPFTANPQGAAVDQATVWWDSMQQQFGQMMQAAQASAQSMVDQTTKPTKKSASKSGKAGQSANKT
jgi:hypothetical protein